MKIYTVAFKTYNDKDETVYEIVTPELAWSDKLTASRALREMGGGRKGDNNLVLFSYYLDEPKPVEEEEKEFYVTVAVFGRSYEDARAKLADKTGLILNTPS